MCDKCGCGETQDQKTLEEKVKETLQSIQSSLEDHGGGVELVGIDADNTVKVRLQGACQGCPGAQMTMKEGIERMLKEKVPEIKEVVAVN